MVHIGDHNAVFLPYFITFANPARFCSLANIIGMAFDELLTQILHSLTGTWNATVTSRLNQTSVGVQLPC